MQTEAPSVIIQQLHKHPPVAFAKFRLQEADTVSRSSIFLLQPVKSVNHCNTESVQMKHLSKWLHTLIDVLILNHEVTS